jgi:hypothetical protein
LAASSASARSPDRRQVNSEKQPDRRQYSVDGVPTELRKDQAMSGTFADEFPNLR